MKVERSEKGLSTETIATLRLRFFDAALKAKFLQYNFDFGQQMEETYQESYQELKPRHFVEDSLS